MRFYIVSDIHVGSPHAELDRFLTFLARVPADSTLILNGDVLDTPQHPLTAAEQQVVDALVDRSREMPVIWLWGNHDDGYRPADTGEITFAAEYSIGSRVLVAHGFAFDNVMPHHQLFIRLFRKMHALRVKLGAPPVHVAYYAKKWTMLYRILRRHVMLRAVGVARERGFASVVCGHVHYGEETVVEGVHYFNTGAWTELPTFCVEVTDTDIVLWSTDGLLREWASQDR